MEFLDKTFFEQVVIRFPDSKLKTPFNLDEHLRLINLLPVKINFFHIREPAQVRALNIPPVSNTLVQFYEGWSVFKS